MAEQRFERAFAAHGRRVLHFALARTGSAHDAEDIAAETFARFLARIDSVAEPTELSWLFKVAHNLCVDRARAARRIESVADVPERGTLDPALSDAEVWDALGRLAVREQQVVYLRAVEGRSYPEIASALGIGESAAKMRFRRAARKLVIMLGGESGVHEGLETVDARE